jgi:hypothetical protein
MQGSQPVTGKMPVPQVLLLKGQDYNRFKIGLLTPTACRAYAVQPQTNIFGLGYYLRSGYLYLHLD